MLNDRDINQAQPARIVGEPIDDPTIFTGSSYLDLWRSNLQKWHSIRIWDDDNKGFCSYRIHSIRPHPQRPDKYVLISFPYGGIKNLFTGEHVVRLDFIFPEEPA
jgi:hypothetical protein